jgi:glycosyltransferase involved in cell wall biosynthesis/GT2 family glycosyltransferase
MSEKMKLLDSYIRDKYICEYSSRSFSISVIIPAYNREDSLPLVLSKMKELTEHLQDVEILIIDDGSTDRTQQILCEFKATCDLHTRTFYQKNLGAAHARNIGIRESKAPIVLFLDSDIIPSKELVESHREFHQRYPQETFVLRGRIETPRNVEGIRHLDTIVQMKSDQDFQEMNWTELRSNNISIKKSFVLKTGGFDRDLSAHQDTELGHRLGKYGMRLFYCYKALGLHYHPVGLKEYFRYAEKYGKSRAVWLAKSPDLIEDAVRAGKEDRFGFISWRSPWRKKVKHILKFILVNRFTVKGIIAVGHILERKNISRYFFFYRQAYQFYSYSTFKRYWKQIKSGKLVVKRPLRICMLAGPLPPEFSGAAIQSLNLSRYLQQLGQNVFYISPSFQNNLPREEYIRGIKVYRVFMKSKSSLEKFKFSIKVFRLLIRYREQFDIVHIHGGGFLTTGATFIGMVLGKKSIYKMTSFGEDDAQKIKSSRYNWLKFPLFNMATKVIAISSGLEKSYLESNLAEGKLCCIPNAVDAQRFSPVSAQRKREIRAKLNLPADTFIAVTVASISRRKRIDFLLDAWRKVIEKDQNVLLVIVGQLKDDETGFIMKVRDLLTSPAYTNKVVLSGMQENVEEYLQASDIFVFASCREGFATVQIEAMACGLPCVCSYIAGISEDIFINGENGIIVYEDSPEIFARKIIAVMENPQLIESLAKNARATVEKKFSLKRVGQQYMNLYTILKPGIQSLNNMQLLQA